MLQCYYGRFFNYTVHMQSNPIPQVVYKLATPSDKPIHLQYVIWTRYMILLSPQSAQNVGRARPHPSLSSRIGHLRRALLMQDICNASHDPVHTRT
jgi:hypothetical protein